MILASALRARYVHSPDLTTLNEALAASRKTVYVIQRLVQAGRANPVATRGTHGPSYQGDRLSARSNPFLRLEWRMEGR
jgi:hypothetical protein